MVVVDVARAAIITGLAAAILTGSAGLVLIYLTAFTTGVGSALRDTAAACVPQLADPADLDRANARMIAGQVVGNELAGPAAGGWLFGLAAVLPFAVSAGILWIAVLLLAHAAGRVPAGKPASTPGVGDVAGGAAAGVLRRPAMATAALCHPDVTIAVGVIASWMPPGLPCLSCM
jgi:hypothetical protein